MRPLGHASAIALSLATALSGSVALADGHGAETTDMRLRAALAGEHRPEEKRPGTYIATRIKH